jgi:hypothetical protein
MNYTVFASTVLFVAGAVFLIVGNSGLGAVFVALGAVFIAISQTNGSKKP